KANFGERHRGEGPYADLIAQRFAAAHRKIGFTKGSWGLDCTQFRKSKGTDQLDLFADPDPVTFNRPTGAY
ncbi:MAG: hypothetical protein AAGF58_10600, partial [Pseudomonadota bacterium]